MKYFIYITLIIIVGGIILIIWISGISNRCGFHIYSSHPKNLFVEFESLGKDGIVYMEDSRVEV